MSERPLPEEIRAPRFSVVIACRPGSRIERPTRSIEAARIHPSRLEIIVVTGLNPSAQRNAGARAAQGDYLLFLDDDSEVSPAIFEEYEKALAMHPRAPIFGGPALHEAEPGNLFQEALVLAFRSPFWVGPLRARYQAIGKTREASERALILCNLLVRRDFFLAQNGFDPEFHPSEENEFLNRIFGQAPSIYHPGAKCRRRPRESWAELIRQIYRYGQGRAQQLGSRGARARSLPHAIPAFFVIYVLALPLLIASGNPIIWLPFAIYLGLAAGISLTVAFRARRFTLFPRLLASLLIFHFYYGVGWIAGVLRLVSGKSRTLGEIRVTTLRAFSSEREAEVAR